MKKRKTARDSALTMLERCDRTEKEMRQKLKEREYTPDEIDETVEFLKEYRYINDAEYAGRYIRVYSSKKSIRQIHYNLEQKGISRDLMEAAFGENLVNEEAQVRHYLTKKGYQPGERMEPNQYRRLTGALCRKGFSYDVIRRVTDQMCQDELS